MPAVQRTSTIQVTHRSLRISKRSVSLRDCSPKSAYVTSRERTNQPRYWKCLATRCRLICRTVTRSRPNAAAVRCSIPRPARATVRQVPSRAAGHAAPASVGQARHALAAAVALNAVPMRASGPRSATHRRARALTCRAAAIAACKHGPATPSRVSGRHGATVQTAGNASLAISDNAKLDRACRLVTTCVGGRHARVRRRPLPATTCAWT